MAQQRHKVELPETVEDAFQGSRHRVKASRVDFYSGFIAALQGPPLSWITTRQLVDQYDEFDLGEDYEDDE